MSNTIQIKRNTSGAPSSLDAGELAVNLTDKKLWVGNNAGDGVLHLNDHLPLAGGTLTGNLTINSDNATLRLNDSTSGSNFNIFSNGSELRMAQHNATFPGAYLNLTTAGNLGLGVTGASERLEVAGKAIFTDTLSAANANEELLAVKADYGSATTNGSFGGFISFYHRTGGNLLQSRVNIGIVGQSNNAADLIFRTSAGAGATPATRLTITSAGDSKFTGTVMPSASNTYTLGTNANRWSNIYGSAGDFSGNLTVSGSCTFAALSGTTGSFSGDITITNGIKLSRTSQYETLISCEDSGENQTLKILGNRLPSNGSSGTDVRIGGEQDRTTGNAFQVIQGSSTYFQIASSGAATFLGSGGVTVNGNLTVSGTTSTFGTNGSIILKDPYASNDAALEIKRDAGANSSILLHGEGDSYIANGITGGLAVGSTSPSGFKLQVAGTAKITSNLTVGGTVTATAFSGTADKSDMVTGSAFATTGSPSSVLEYQQAANVTDTKLAPTSDWYNTIRLGHGNPYSYYSNTIAVQMTGTGAGQIRTQLIYNNNAQGWRTVWDNVNDGSGSGLDADLLDGLQATSFLRSDASDTASGDTYTFNSGSTSVRMSFTGHAGEDYYNYFLNASNDGGTKAVHFVNGSTRSGDGGPNAYTIRNDGGKLILGRTNQITDILGSTVSVTGNLTGSGTLGTNASRWSTIYGSAGNFSGNVTLNSRLTFSYNSHYFEAGTNSVAFKNSSGTSYLSVNNTETTVSGNLTVGGTTSLGSSQKLQWGDASTYITGSNSGDFLQFYPDGNVQLTLNSSGATIEDSLTVGGTITLASDSEHSLSKVTTSAVTGSSVETTDLRGRNIDLYAFDDINLRAGTGDTIRLFARGSTEKFTIKDEVVVNEGGQDVNFRVEGDSDSNLIVADASADRVGIGVAVPSAKLHSSGTIRVGSSPFTDYKTSQQYSSGTYSVALASGSFNIADNNNAAKFTITPSTGAASFTNNLTVGGTTILNGNVSINHSYNGQSLNISGNIYTIGGSNWVNNGQGFVSSSSTNTGVYPHSTSGVSLNVAGSTKFNVNSTGASVTDSLTVGGTATINGASTVGNSKLVVAGVAQTGVMSDVMSVTVPNTAGNRGGYAVRNSAGGIVGTITGEVVTAGTYPNAVGKIDICVQNGGSSLKGLSIANTGDVTTNYKLYVSGYLYPQSGISLNDNKKLLVGNTSDLQIYHDGSHSIILDNGTGDLHLRGNVVRIKNAAGTENMASFVQDGEVALAYNNVTRLTTTSTGVSVTDSLTVGGATSIGTGGTAPYAYDTTATKFEVSTGTTTVGEVEVARFRGGDDADTGAAIVRITNDNDRGLVLKGGRTGTAAFADIGVSSWDGSFISSLRVDGAGQVGVGTIPSQKLHVNGAVKATAFQTITGNNRTKIKFWDTSTNYGIGMYDNHTYGGLDDDYCMTFQFSNHATRGFWWGDSSHTNAQGAMALTTDGKLTVAHSMRLGFGESDTTTPGSDATLHVQGTDSRFTAASPTTAAHYLRLKHDNTEGVIDANRGNLKLQANDYVYTTNNFGIGTVAPTNKITVAGGSQYTKAYLSQTADIHIANTSGSGVGSYAGAISFCSTVEANLQAASIAAIQTGSDQNQIGLTFNTQVSTAGSTDLAEAVRIKHDGSVGIGVAPAATLHVLASSPEFRLSTASSAVVRLRTSGDNYINTGQKLGLGTASPAQNLHVQGTTSIVHIESSTANANASVWFKSNVSGTVANRWEIGTNISRGASLEIFDRLNSTSRLELTNGGLLGIGTGSSGPLSRFNVKGSQGNWRVDTDGVSNEIQVLATTPANDGFRTYRLRANETIFDTNGSERLKIDTSGNITHQGGSPEYHFGTDSTDHCNWRIACQEVVDQGFEIASGTTSAGSNAASDTYTTRFVVKGSGTQAGNVSIGSTSTAYGRLFVDATSSPNSAAALAVRGRTSDASYIAVNVLNSGDGSLFSVLNDGKATFSGSVGIGSSPSAKLHVNGDSYFASDMGIGMMASSTYRLSVSDTGNSPVQIQSTSNNLNFTLGSTTQTQYTNILFNSNSGNAQIWKGGGSYTDYGGASSLNLYCSNGKIAFHPGANANEVVIQSDGDTDFAGRVGIGGNHNNSYQLIVTGNSYFNGGSNSSPVTLRTSATTGGNYLPFTNTNGQLGYVGWGSAGNNDLYLVNQGGSNTGSIRLYAGSSTKVLVASDGDTDITGRLGVGGSHNNSYKLYVNGTSYFSGAAEFDAGIKDKDGSLGTNGHVLHTNGSDVYWAAASGGSSYTLPFASDTTLGGIKIDGNDFTINSSTAVMTLHSTVTKRYSTYVQMDSSLSDHHFTINHGLGSQDVIVQVRTYAGTSGETRAQRFSNKNGTHLDIGYDVQVCACDTNGTLSGNHISLDFEQWMDSHGVDDEYLYVTIIG